MDLQLLASIEAELITRQNANLPNETYFNFIIEYRNGRRVDVDTLFALENASWVAPKKVTMITIPADMEYPEATVRQVAELDEENVLVYIQPEEE